MKPINLRGLLLAPKFKVLNLEANKAGPEETKEGTPLPAVDATECPVCLTYMVEPTKLACNHYFCIQCMEQLKKEDEFEEELKCPLCRNVQDKEEELIIDNEYLQKLKVSNKREYFNAFNELRHTNMLKGDLQLEFEIGNNYHNPH